MSNLKNPVWPSDTQDYRNVIDYYKYWKHEAIIADQDKNRCKLKIVAENFGNDFNVSTVIRSSNAFLCNEVIIVGRRRWDRRGACGMQNYEHVRHAETISHVLDSNPTHRIVVLDNIPGASDIYSYKWQEETILILGQESIGVSPESISAAHDVVYIPQWGSVRSLNVGSAATVAMAFYRGQWGGSTNSVPVRSAIDRAG
jgi:tRNA G18 (ribose-2'-O)-methylase SpoU